MTNEQPVGHLQRRKIEGRVLVPFIAACREKFGDAATQELITGFIEKASVSDGVKSACGDVRLGTSVRVEVAATNVLRLRLEITDPDCPQCASVRK